jgi:hypothetical protein
MSIDDRYRGQGFDDGFNGTSYDDFDSTVLASDFELIDNPIDKDTYAISIKQGKWAGVSVMYGQVRVAEDTASEQGILKFTYQLIDPADFNNTALESDNNFIKKLGDILSFILYENLKTGTAEIGHINPDSDTHS